ncbi:MAG TPA: hypothetical protein VNT60_02435 [Deinococcales bacterium]|nr:hypothetical protein [Deinococcales bacterium]
MLLRAIYQAAGWITLALGALFVVLGLYRAIFDEVGLNAIVIGLFVGAFLIALGWVIRQFATGPAQGGIEVVGVAEKAETEKTKALGRKAAPAK